MKMKNSRRKILTLIVLLFSSFGFVKWLRRKKLDGQVLLYTSDIHLSLPQGRWQHCTKNFNNFLKNSSFKKYIFFVNGDYIDCAFSENGRIKGGGKNYQIEETNLFINVTKNRFKKIMYNFGAGHDFGNIETAEILTQTKRIGIYQWEKVNIVWFTVFTAAFGETNALKDDEYLKLEEILSTSKNILLMTHIPLRTKLTYELGKWSNNTNLTIPNSDKIYSILKKFRNNILAIFQGHIHEEYKSSIFNIPIFCFPFIKNNSHCLLIQDKQQLVLRSSDNSKINQYFTIN